MKRFIITEEEKNNIRKMYGFINEQTSLPVATSSAGATATAPTIETKQAASCIKIAANS